MAGTIEKITIKGFKSIRELVDFELRNLNVIVGANGAGKSNFVQIFRMVHAMALKGFQEFVVKAGGADAFPYNGLKTTPEIEIGFTFGKNAYRFALTPTADEMFSISEARQYLDHGWKSYGTGLLESRLQDEKDEDSSYYPGSRGVGHYVYDAISRWTVYHFHDTSATAPMRRSEIVEDSEKLRNDGGNIAPFLRAMRDGDAFQRESYKRIVETVRQVTPFFDDFKLDVVKVGEADKVKLSWRQKGSDYPFQPYHFSDGSIRFICLAAALLQPRPPSTIVIDEPELGLHPMAISLLADMIRTAARHTQVIVATQCPQLIDQFGVEDLIVARRVGGASAFERLKAEDFKAWLEDYSLGELWQKNIINGGPAHE